MAVPFVFCIDVGGPKKIGWADSTGASGAGGNLAYGLSLVCDILSSGHPVAIGFEAPIWTPVRDQLNRVTGRRGGIETTMNRAWSAGAGSGALGAALALMPWCFSQIARTCPTIPASVRLDRFLDRGGLFIWEAFVSASLKREGTTHCSDARLACDAFVSRWPQLGTDIPPEPALNHAVSAALVSGISISADEMTSPATVIGLTSGNYNVDII